MLAVKKLRDGTVQLDLAQLLQSPTPVFVEIGTYRYELTEVPRYSSVVGRPVKKA